MKKIIILIMLLIGLFLGYLSTRAATCPYSWQRDLYVGSSGPDITSLQEFLNLDPNTKVADGGPGSPGKETRYFGELTKDAVIRFQMKYPDEILFAHGLRSPTGNVGKYTRARINTLCSK